VAALLIIAAAAALPARAVEPPGSRNFTAPSYVPDYFSNESGPLHTGANSRPAADASLRAIAPTARAGGRQPPGRRLHRRVVLRRHVYRRHASHRPGRWQAVAVAHRHRTWRHRSVARHKTHYRRHLPPRARSLAAAHRLMAASHRRRTRARAK
jgi:hypothetical protein